MNWVLLASSNTSDAGVVRATFVILGFNPLFHTTCSTFLHWGFDPLTHFMSQVTQSPDVTELSAQIPVVDVDKDGTETTVTSRSLSMPGRPIPADMMYDTLRKRDFLSEFNGMLSHVHRAVSTCTTSKSSEGSCTRCGTSRICRTRKWWWKRARSHP